MPDTASPAQAKAIKRRLLDRVADDEDTHVTIASDEGDWRPFVPGVHIKVLYRQGGVQSYLLKLEAGATLPAHRHPLDEECVVLEGTLEVGTRITVGPGGYHLAHQGALHAPVRTVTGATIFLRGAIPDAQHVLA